jgi:endoglucanase
MRSPPLLTSFALRASLLGAALLATSAGMERSIAGAQESEAVVVPAGHPRDMTALAGAPLFVSPASSAHRQARKWRRSRPDDAALMEHIAGQPIATWLGEWSGNVRSAVKRTVAAAQATSRVPVLVAYYLPNRDCGGHSAGGARSAESYRGWIRKLAAGIGAARPVIVLEPDGLAGMDCLPPTVRATREELIRDAIGVLKAAGAVVYVDAGNARWHRPETMASRLTSAGIAAADGFTLNVANFVPTGVSITYGDAISALTGGKHYVIDTSRNGVGGTPDGEWCNPAGQALGESPTTRTGHALADAFLWIKVPGESDGRCNGGPRAGTWWTDYALGLARERQQLAVPPETLTTLALLDAVVQRAITAALDQTAPAR